MIPRLRGGHAGPPLLLAAACMLLFSIPATAQDRTDQPTAEPRLQQPERPTQPPKPAQPARPAPAAKPAPPAPPAEPAPPTPPAPPGPPETPAQAINVRIDVTITEQQAGGTPTKKTVSLVVADGETGYARSEAVVMRDGYQHLPLNVDARPRVIDSNRARVRLVVNWTVLSPQASPGGPANSTQVTQQVAPILESGKSLVVAQSADPVSDRQVTVEVKATILR